MKNRDSWNSQYRKRRFYERQELKQEILKDSDDNCAHIPKTIAVMLDLDGTTDFIDDEKAKLFMKQLEIIRRKFGAKLATISISTHYRDSSRMKDTLDILARNLSKNIKLGISFYYGGIYDYDKKKGYSSKL